MKLLTTTMLLAVAATARPAPPPEGGEILVDRIVAVVDEDPILLSDIRRFIALGLVKNEPEEGERKLYRRVLDGLIDQRLRLHEVESHDFSPLPAEEVERQIERIRASFPDPEKLQGSLDRLGLDDEGLALLVGRQLRVLLYVEKRLGPRVFIRQEDVRAYYEDVLVAEMAHRQLAAPPLEKVREDIRNLLHEKRLNAEIDAWTQELRLGADVVDYLDRVDTELPPVIERLDGN